MINLKELGTKAVIFDMDGTMVDNMMVHQKAWQQKLKELGLDLPMEEVMQKVHGINEEILERLFGASMTVEERAFHAFDKEARYREIFKDSLSLIDGLDDYLQSLSALGMRLAIGSAAPPENVDFVLDNLDIRDRFDVVLHAGDVEKGKPDPEIYLKILDRLKLAPEECVIFEDTPVGAEAAVNAGVKVVVITTTHNQEEFAHLEVENFIENYEGLVMA